MKNANRATFFAALKTMSPIMIGFVPTAAAYALLCRAQGIQPLYVILSSLIVFAGSVQFISIELIRAQMDLLQYALVIFLLHSRHIFYGISVFGKYEKCKRVKPVMIFWLTDEAYAVFTGTKTPNYVKEGLYYFLIAFFGYAAWNTGTALGVLAAGFMSFDLTGLDFTMTAMFIVVGLEQLSSFKSRLPFVIGGVTAVFSLIILGPSTMLLGCAVCSVALLLLLRDKIEENEKMAGVDTEKESIRNGNESIDTESIDTESIDTESVDIEVNV